MQLTAQEAAVEPLYPVIAVALFARTETNILKLTEAIKKIAKNAAILLFDELLRRKDFRCTLFKILKPAGGSIR